MKARERFHKDMASKLTRSHTWVLAAMDLEKEEIRIKFLHPTTKSLPTRPQFQILDVSLELTSVPLVDKFNFHRQVGEMLYNDLGKNIMTIN